MNTDILEGKWKNLKGQVREQWGKLTDDDVEEVGGRKDALVGKIQERYGESKDKAAKKVNEFLDRFDDKRDDAKRKLQS